MTILDTIFAHKRTEVAAAKAGLPLAQLEQLAAGSPPAPDFVAALRNTGRPTPRLIAEIKHRSPSKGLLCPDFDPLHMAQTYAANGAAAISVLTDTQFFGGSLDYLRDIAALKLGTPLLRKDFIFERYQLLEARVAGASAALLIVAMLDHATLARLIAAAHALQITPLVEVHTHPELTAALQAGATVIGVNNRNLHTFETSLDVTASLRPHVPNNVTLVAESGIRTLHDVARLAALNVDAMLIGEGIVTAPDKAARVRQFSQLAEPVTG